MWLDRLDDILHPLLPRQGDLSQLRLHLIPDAQYAFRVVKQWILDILYHLNPARPELQFRFLTNFYRSTSLGILLDASKLYTTLDRVYCVHFFFHPSLRVQARGGITNALFGLVDVMRGQDILDLRRGTLFLR